jgi:hypothetical protein
MAPNPIAIEEYFDKIETSVRSARYEISPTFSEKVGDITVDIV